MTATWTMAGLALAAVTPVMAQQAPAPSQITPPSLRPDAAPAPMQVIIPDADGLHPPAGAESMAVTPGSITVEGDFPELAGETRRIVVGLQDRRVTLQQIYAAASAIERRYAQAGYVLVRVALPPQKLTDGGPLRLIVIDGFIEDVSVSGVPARVRTETAARLAGLKNERHITLADIQQPLLIAGDIPGLRLTSTLIRGDQPGSTRLVLDGRQALLSGAISFDNNLPSSLDTYGLNAQLALNSALGLGEQIYGFGGGGYDLAHMFSSQVRARVLGGGIALPLAAGRLTINPEVTFSRTQPAPEPDVPLTRGDLRRLTLRTSYVVARRRDHSLNLSATIEQIDETNLLTQFDELISHDRFMAARIGLDYNLILGGGQSGAFNIQLSRGLGGLGALSLANLPADVTYSRQGAQRDFTKLTASARANIALDPGLWINVTARGQTSFGQPLFRSEQALLEGADGLSAYVGAVTSVDSDATLRGELSVPFTRLGLQIAPYGFGAGGIGRIEDPTALEPGTLRAASMGVGVRVRVPGVGINLGAEYAHGFANLASLDGVNRVNVTASVHF